MEQIDFEKISVLDRNYAATNEQIQIVEQELSSLAEFLTALKHLNNTNEKKILTPLGRGIFFSAQRTDDSKLFVEVGAGVFVKKTLAETIKVVSEQIERLNEAYNQLKTQEAFYSSQLREFIEQAEKMRSAK